MDARERFKATRRAVSRLNEVHLLLMNECDDWKPPTVKTRTDKSDPTADRAIYNVDELGEKLEALRNEERELTDLIGTSLAIIEAVRVGFSEQYADWLEWRYIDLWTWEQFADKLGIESKKAREKVRYWCGVTFDWIDSVGVSRLLCGEVDV